MSFILLILCHPRKGSFNHALAGRVRETLTHAGHEIRFHDLYEEGFDPVLGAEELARRFSFDSVIQGHYRDLAESEGIVIVHPDWWGQPPAILKGWVDRVFRQGIAYDFEGEEFVRKTKVPLLSGKRALVFCTTDELVPPGDSRRKAAAHPTVAFWRDRVFGYCGAEAAVKVYGSVREADAALLRRWREDAGRTAAESFP